MVVMGRRKDRVGEGVVMLEGKRVKLEELEEE